MYELRAVTVFACLQAPDCSVVGVGEKILLFRHQPASEELLRRLTDQDELQHGDLIEVIIAGQTATAWKRKTDLPALFKRNRSLILAGNSLGLFVPCYIFTLQEKHGHLMFRCSVVQVHFTSCTVSQHVCLNRTQNQRQ